MSGGDNDQCKSGILHIYNPSDTTFVKHFIYTGNKVQHNQTLAVNNYIAGYFNTTSAINAVDFKMKYQETLMMVQYKCLES
jgi:hypothetical protein